DGVAVSATRFYGRPHASFCAPEHRRARICVPWTCDVRESRRGATNGDHLATKALPARGPVSEVCGGGGLRLATSLARATSRGSRPTRDRATYWRRWRIKWPMAHPLSHP